MSGLRIQFIPALEQVSNKPRSSPLQCSSFPYICSNILFKGKINILYLLLVDNFDLKTAKLELVSLVVILIQLDDMLVSDSNQKWLLSLFLLCIDARKGTKTYNIRIIKIFQI